MSVKTKRECKFDKEFDDLSRSVDTCINSLQKNKQYYVTPEICRELRHLKNGVQHMRLDDDLLRSSREWCQKNDAHSLEMERKGAKCSLNVAKSRLEETGRTIDVNNFSKLLDGQSREAHHNTVGRLRNAQREMGPFAHGSVNRLQNFCDFVGVTDRYQSYRGNLNYQRPSTNRPIPARYQYESRQTQSAPVQCRVKERSPIKERSIQEQCGINTLFPGISEYAERYIKPREKESTDFEINPSPDFSRTGRRIATLRYVPGTSEYQTKYIWPDGSTLKSAPWIAEAY
ncbi:DgyrCDS4693 [Dimorphilus gyrociliatus]|uniref:DgyrCDS4693 n=1 Tax=Dimorphilus gyrociliatus TaxID=2664684 RepID=A0A7I8VJ58_9ANNE|nr:DgyrCDS4693 [Dimorphilus gyrociliatus]